MIKYIQKLIANFKGIYLIADRRSLLMYLCGFIINLGSIIYSKNLVAADSFMKGRICKFNIKPGIKVRINGDYFSGAREMYCRQVYFASVNVQLSEGDVVIDLGANRGLFTIMAAQIASKVIAIEAQDGFIDTIKNNVRENNCSDRCIIINALIGAKSGILSSKDGQQAASHWEHAPETLSMNDLIDKFNLDKVDLLKVDIEGSEFDLFNEDTKWLGLVKKIAMEVHPTFGDTDKLKIVLEKAGFLVEIFDNDLVTTNMIPKDGGYYFCYRSSSIN